MRKVLILLVVLVAIPAAAQWHRAGLHGADVRALIADPVDPDTMYLGTSSGDVYVSRDGAKSWTSPRNGTPFPNYVVDNLLLDREGHLWAAGWGLWGGGVIAMSPDGGKSWQRRDSGLEDFSVRAIVIDPSDAKFIVVGGLTGVYRSADAGRNWEKISDQINVESLAIDPRSHDRIYIGTWRQGWRTDDGGKSWKQIAEGMVLDTDMFSITVDPAQPDNLWVATCGWVYNSTNGGDLWTRYRDGFNNRRIHDVELDPCDPDVVYAGSVAGLYRSEDRGKSWYVLSDEGLVINTIVLHPQRPDRIVLGIEGDGVYVSQDRGRTFERASFGLHNVRIAAIAPDPFQKDRVYGAVMFGGASSGLYRSEDGGRTWEKISRTALPEILSLSIATEADADVKFLAGTEKGFFWSQDGQEWTQAEPSGFPIRVAKIIRFNRDRAFAATAEGVFTSRDGGRNWYRLGGAKNRAVDLALGQLEEKPALYALTSAGVELFDGEAWTAITDAPAKGRTLAIRTIDGIEHVFIAGSQGVNAGTVDPATKAWVPFESPSAQYAAVYGGARSGGQMLFLTSRQQREILVGEPSNTAWMQLTLPVQNAEVTSVVADPFNMHRFYVGTLGDGVFIYEGKTQAYVAASEAQVPVGGGRP
jgi:photosystem II stability/assembly factor-like uncharacterized protein